MADANPTCATCCKPKVWIGIGPGAEAACTPCDEVAASKPACTRCGSKETEALAVFTFWQTGSKHEPGGAFHCWPCGKVFTP